MINFLIAVGILACALLAIRENRLLISALWLALTSALVAFLMYQLGAAEVGAVELSVGAGLVTVLFVFAINITGGDEAEGRIPIPRPAAWIVVVVTLLLLSWMILPSLQLERYFHTLTRQVEIAGLFRSILWGDRQVDILLQIVLIFAGVLAVLGLIGDIHEKGKEKGK
jgi:multicomponent Na+:H+ antiporter subunit B